MGDEVKKPQSIIECMTRKFTSFLLLAGQVPMFIADIITGLHGTPLFASDLVPRCQKQDHKPMEYKNLVIFVYKKSTSSCPESNKRILIGIS